MREGLPNLLTRTEPRTVMPQWMGFATWFSDSMPRRFWRVG